MDIVNWNLLKHPVNWFTIVLMVLLAAIAGHLTLSYLGIEPATGTQNQ